MKKIKVNTQGKPYEILIGLDLIKQAGNLIKKINLGDSAFIITNKKIEHCYGRLLAESLHKNKISAKFCRVLDSEKSKSMETAFKVIKQLNLFDFKMRVFIIALGGGVIGDLSGFVASIYKRGIPYIQIPTTLLGQVDSAIGGKTAVDLESGKNLVGAFYQPRMVISDTCLLKSLTLRQLRAGLSEIIKYALISDSRLFAKIESRYQDILSLKNTLLIDIITRCSAIKAGIVSRDEKEEKGLRTLLNFGHTIGHAIETAAGYNLYNHGEAVAIGMVAAAKISQKIGLLKPSSALRIEKLIKNCGLPVKARRVSAVKIMQAHYHDKKFIGNENRFVLLERIGKAKVVLNVPLKIISECL